MLALEFVASFVVAAVTLLGIPGPSNALVANVGVMRGPRAGWLTVPAVVLGYAIVVVALTVGLKDWLTANPLASLILRVACALYLLKVAWTLWQDATATAGTAQIAGAGLAPFREVFIVTLLNPKGLVGGLVLIPQFYQLANGAVATGLYIGLFLLVAGLITAAYTLAGALLNASASSERPKIVFARCSAVVVVVFAFFILFGQR